MTRDEAIEKVNTATVDSPTMRHVIVDSLIALDTLKVEDPEADKMRLAAVTRLTGTHVVVHVSSRSEMGETRVLAQDGALEVLDVLLKSGFKITR